MNHICQRILLEGVDMKSLDALEFYAREGDWQTVVYANKVKSLEAWEINPQYLPALRSNIPHARIRICDSYLYGAHCANRFDFIVLDNPQGLFGDELNYCEHFEALPVALRLLNQYGFLIFNINWAPFDLSSQSDWANRRNKFYQRSDTNVLSIHDFILPFYDSYFCERGYTVQRRFYQPRNNEYLGYAIYQLVSTTE